MQRRHWYVILNPASGGRRHDGARARLRAALDRAGLGHEIAESRDIAELERLAHEARRLGHRSIAVAGGDGSAHAVLNGVLADAGSDAGAAPTLGLLPLGSGNDWARSLGIPRELDAACRLLATGAARVLDLGEATLLHAGQRRSRYFMNVAGAGLDAHVVRALQGHSAGPWRYLAALPAAAWSFQVPALELRAGELHHAGTMLAVLAAIGRYCGGGMRVAPHASLDDGLFDLTIVRRMTPLAVLANVPRLLFGDVARSPHVRSLRAASLEIDGVTDLEADGELLGRTPASLRLLPRALAVVTGPGACVERPGSAPQAP